MTRETRRSKQSVVWWRALDRVRYWIVLYDRIYGPEPPTPADLKCEADHEKLVRVFPVVGETIEPNKTYAGAKSRRRFRISNIDSAAPLPSFAAPSTQTEPDLGVIAGGQKRRGYGGELRECSDTAPWWKRQSPF